MISILIVCWFLVSAVDDFVILLAWLCALADRQEGPVWPKPGELFAARERRIAIFVPAWHEEAVIARMLEQNTASLRYRAYTILVGTYPNDRGTQAAVRRAAESDSRIELVVGPRPGPTSKADCLNALYKRMCEMEEQAGSFELVLIHDAEDVLHPDELHWKNWFAAQYDMVQTAVLPIATPAHEFTHGLYCDDFAEFHTKDLRARNWLGGFVPSCGVATAFARDQLQRLAAADSAGRPFSPDCLTEDYELGFRLHCQGARQIFVALPSGKGPLLATREFFPRKLRAAVRQRSRWVSGIVFQGWRNHSWGRNVAESYWFWRDRKGLIGSPLSLVTSIAMALHFGLNWRFLTVSNGLARLVFVATILSAANLVARCWCSACVYGLVFGLFAPLRQLWGNLVNTLAVVSATRAIARSWISGGGLAWGKTDHAYPWAGADASSSRSLPEILIDKGFISAEKMKSAARVRPPGVGLAAFLWRTGQISAAELQLARNEQHGFAGTAGHAWEPCRVLPVALAERWRVVPVGIGAGEIRLASVELPKPGLGRALAQYTRFHPRFVLVTPARFGRLRRQFHSQMAPVKKK